MKKYIFTFLFFFCSFLSFATSFESINFDKGKVKPNTDGKGVLKRLLLCLKNDPLADFILEGHTDSYECKDSISAIKLSKERLYFCVNFLIKNGIDSCRLKTSFHGKDQPTVPNDVDGIPNELNQAINRRVRVIPTMRDRKIFAQSETNSLDSLITFAKQYKRKFPDKHIVVFPCGDEKINIKDYLGYHLPLAIYTSINTKNIEDTELLEKVKAPKKLYKYATHILLDGVYDYDFENSDNFVVFVLEWTCEE
ncbi:OmpA family protein [Bernardetia sp. OM2101]|uniref:OmpA family protein n=1 Tax=Bernardetia sp. OM2101 TaxID=3344876 RepID=UPI0035CFF4B9